MIAERFKVDLPNYGEFDEKRVFQAGPDMPGPVNFRGVRLGIPICEDIWGDLGVCETLAESGAEILLRAERLALLSRQGRCAPPGGAPAGDRERAADDLSPTSLAARTS